MPFPPIPNLRQFFEQYIPGYWEYWQRVTGFMNQALSTEGDITLKPGKGIILTSADGTKTGTVYLKNDGTLSL